MQDGPRVSQRTTLGELQRLLCALRGLCGESLLRMRRGERQRQDELGTDGPSPRGGASVFRTRTRVDTGGWLGRSRVRVCLTGDELVLFAAGRQPFVERIPVRSLDESFYNHVTGEVALAPAEGARVKRLRIRPVEGYALLDEIATGTSGTSGT